MDYVSKGPLSRNTGVPLRLLPPTVRGRGCLEGRRCQGVTSSNRSETPAALHLAIWTCPLACSAAGHAGGGLTLCPDSLCVGVRPLVLPSCRAVRRLFVPLLAFLSAAHASPEQRKNPSNSTTTANRSIAFPVLFASGLAPLSLRGWCQQNAPQPGRLVAPSRFMARAGCAAKASPVSHPLPFKH